VDAAFGPDSSFDAAATVPIEPDEGFGKVPIW